MVDANGEAGRCAIGKDADQLTVRRQRRAEPVRRVPWPVRTWQSIGVEAKTIRGHRSDASRDGVAERRRPDSAHHNPRTILIAAQIDES